LNSLKYEAWYPGRSVNFGLEGMRKEAAVPSSRRCSSVCLEHWFLVFLVLLTLELANEAVITPPFLNCKYKRKETHEIITKSYFIVIIWAKYVDPLANKNRIRLEKRSSIIKMQSKRFVTSR
jgi:hypothetical protein